MNFNEQHKTIMRIMKQPYEMPETEMFFLQEEKNLCTSAVETDNVSIDYDGFNNEQEW